MDPRLSLTFMQNSPTKTQKGGGGKEKYKRARCNRRWTVTLCKRTKCLWIYLPFLKVCERLKCVWKLCLHPKSLSFVDAKAKPFSLIWWVPSQVTASLEEPPLICSKTIWLGIRCLLFYIPYAENHIFYCDRKKWNWFLILSFFNTMVECN